MSETRKIAAILVSDIVGYSRLAGADEDLLLARLRTLRSDLIDPIIAVHRGRVVKRTGDGALVEFRSVVDAVRCAIEVQNGMIERNTGLPPERRIEFRMGIHLGDVVEEADGDLMGDGVNIAARLEGVAQPGSICLSEDAYRQVSARLDMAVADLGPTQLKNIERPIRVYSLKVGQPAQAKAEQRPPKKRVRLGGLSAVGMIAATVFAVAGFTFFRPSQAPKAEPAAFSHAVDPESAIAVLPFDNLGGDEQAGRLADGMTEDIITNLARYQDLSVIARNSTMIYKGKPVDIRQVGKDLGVRFILLGSIQRQNDDLRVAAQLIDGATGAHVWSERWNRPGTDLFAVQSEVADKVAVSIAGNADQTAGAIQRVRLSQAKQKHPANLSAYDFTVLANEQRGMFTKSANARGLEYTEKAITLDSNFAPAYVSRSWLKFQSQYLFDIAFGSRDEEIRADLKKALAIDPTNTEALSALSNLNCSTDHPEKCFAEFEGLMRENPTNITVLTLTAFNITNMGYVKEAVAAADLALRLDPRMSPSRRMAIQHSYFIAQKFERYIEVTDLIPDETRNKYIRLQRAASYAFLGRSEEAQRAKAELIDKHGEQVEEIWLNEGEVFSRQTERDIQHEAFRKLGFRICATAEELKKTPNPRRFPECVK